MRQNYKFVTRLCRVNVSYQQPLRFISHFPFQTIHRSKTRINNNDQKSNSTFPTHTHLPPHFTYETNSLTTPFPIPKISFLVSGKVQGVYFRSSFPPPPQNHSSHLLLFFLLSSPPQKKKKKSPLPPIYGNLTFHSHSLT